VVDRGRITVRNLPAELIVTAVKTLLSLLTGCVLLLASERQAQAQISWGIPLPFPFLFYNFNQGYYSQPVYYNQRYYYRPANCTPARATYFYRGSYRPYYYPPRYYYRPPWPPGYYGPGYYGPGRGGYGGW